MKPGYGNPAYRRAVNVSTVSGWLLVLLCVLSAGLLISALVSGSGFARSWRLVLAMQIARSLVDGVENALLYENT